MGIGRRNTRVTIRDFSEARNTGGGVDFTWSDVRTVWAHVRQLKEGEINRGGAITASSTHAVEMDFFDGLAVGTDQRLVIKPEHGLPDQTFEIQRVENKDIGNKAIRFYCSHLAVRTEAAP